MFVCTSATSRARASAPEAAGVGRPRRGHARRARAGDISARRSTASGRTRTSTPAARRSSASGAVLGRARRARGSAPGPARWRAAAAGGRRRSGRPRSAGRGRARAQTRGELDVERLGPGRRLGHAVGVQHVGEQLEAVDQPRARAARSRPRRRPRRRAARRARRSSSACVSACSSERRGVVAARHGDDDLGLGGGDRLPRRLLGVLAGEAEDVLAAGHLDELRRPVAGDEDRVEPLERRHARARRAAHGDAARASTRSRVRATSIERRLRAPVACAIVRTSPIVSPNVLGSSETTFGQVGISSASSRDLVVGDRAHRAQRLGDDQVGLEVAQRARRRARRSPRRARCARATAASISAGDRPGGSTSRVTCGSSRASVG